MAAGREFRAQSAVMRALHPTNNRRIALLVLVGALAVPLTAGGCASKTQGEKSVQSYTETRKTVAESRQQVGMAQASLTNLRRTPPDALKDAFRRYRDTVGELKEGASDAKRRAQAMKEQADTHVQQWQEEMKTIKDPTIKASLESRREAVRTNFALMRMYADDVEKAYEPFLQGNNDMVQALSLDLSPAAITSLESAIDQVVAKGSALDQKLWLMQNALDNMGKGLSPLGNMK